MALNHSLDSTHQKLKGNPSKTKQDNKTNIRKQQVYFNFRSLNVTVCVSVCQCVCVCVFFLFLFLLGIFFIFTTVCFSLSTFLALETPDRVVCITAPPSSEKIQAVVVVVVVVAPSTVPPSSIAHICTSDLFRLITLTKLFSFWSKSSVRHPKAIEANTRGPSWLALSVRQNRLI